MVVGRSVHIGRCTIDEGSLRQHLWADDADARGALRPHDPTRHINEDALTERLITHLRHVDLAVPDYGSQRDFYLDLDSRMNRPGKRRRIAVRDILELREIRVLEQ